MSMLDSNLKIPLAKILDLEVNIDVVDIGASPSGGAPPYQSLIDNSNSSANDPVALTELPSGTFVFSVSAQNSTNYRVSVTDSNETQFGFDPTLKVNAGDDIVFKKIEGNSAIHCTCVDIDIIEPMR